MCVGAEVLMCGGADVMVSYAKVVRFSVNVVFESFEVFSCICPKTKNYGKN